jgi:predicted ATPase/tetratricopeptide (TPR) repeat protein
VQFNPQSDYRLDVAAFKSLLSACAVHPHSRLEACSECVERLKQAMDLYMGEFLRGFSLPGCEAFDEWLLIQREHLRRQASGALQHLVDACEAGGDLDTGLEYAYRLNEINPLSEGAQRQIMRLLALSGQRSQAVAHYESWRQLLEQELGVEPESETSALAERLRLEHSGKSTQGNNLPSSLVPFIGRAPELAALQSYLTDPRCRLITVAGPGGCGKTRLALEAAHARRYHFPHGVYLVSLSALPSSEAVLHAVAGALGFTFREGINPLQQLLDYLRSRSVLLVMDSFEWVPEAAEYAVEILRLSPATKILATSRSRLNVQAEQVFPLGGMRVPQSEEVSEAGSYSAVQLFLSGARRIRPAFEPNATQLNDVARICQLVEGMPLGVLLASAWIDQLTPAQIAAEIERSLDFLAADWVDVPERQVSLRATFDYSWGLLASTEQEILRALSVFRGGFTPQAAEQVCGATFRDLHNMVEKSLLQVSLEGEYRLHDLLRQYLDEKLHKIPAQAAAVQDRHATYYLGKLPGWAAAIKNARQQDTLAQMDAVSADLVTAWEWDTCQARLTGLKEGLEGLCLYHELRARYAEGERLCSVLDRLPDANGDLLNLDLRIHLGTWRGRFAWLSGNLDCYKQSLRESWERLQQAHARGIAALKEEALLLWVQAAGETDLTAARRDYEKALSLLSGISDPWWQARLLLELALILEHSGELSAAQFAAEEALEHLRWVQEPRTMAAAYHRLALAHVRQGHLEEGLEYIHQSEALFKLLDDLAGKAGGLLGIGLVLVWLGEFEKTQQVLAQCQALQRELGNRYLTIYLQSLLGFINLHLGNYVQAYRDGQIALKEARLHGFPREAASAQGVLGNIALVNGDLLNAIEHFTKAIELLSGTKHKEDLSLQLAFLSCADHIQGDRAAADKHLQDAIKIAEEARGYLSMLTVLSIAARRLADQGHVERAVEIQALVSSQPYVANSLWLGDIAGKMVDRLASSLPEKVVAAARQRGLAQDLFKVALVLLGERERENTIPGEATPP